VKDGPSGRAETEGVLRPCQGNNCELKNSIILFKVYRVLCSPDISIGVIIVVPPFILACYKV